MDGRGLLFSAIFPITKAELPLHLSRLPLAALSLTNFRIASHSVHMTRMTFKVEYLNQPLLKKQGFVDRFRGPDGTGTLGKQNDAKVQR
jgi:hypothetical protein